MEHPPHPCTPAGSSRSHWLVPTLLVLAVLAPYWDLVQGRSIPIPDEVGGSDLIRQEFLMRVEAARILRSGAWPSWTPRVSTGGVVNPDPLSLLLFLAAPPALALGLLVGVILVAAARPVRA